MSGCKGLFGLAFHAVVQDLGFTMINGINRIM